MKKFLILLVVIFIPCMMIHGQAPMLVIDTTLNALMTALGIDQVIAFGQMLADNITQISNTVQLIETTKNNFELAMKNWETAVDIRNWDDFMDWYNRQLYLERKANEAYDNINVTIGKKKYHISQIEPSAFDETYLQYWENEFTEEQRREMWMGLGLTPANYAYVQPYRKRASEITSTRLSTSHHFSVVSSRN